MDGDDGGDDKDDDNVASVLLESVAIRILAVEDIVVGRAKVDIAGARPPAALDDIAGGGLILPKLPFTAGLVDNIGLVIERVPFSPSGIFSTAAGVDGNVLSASPCPSLRGGRCWA